MLARFITGRRRRRTAHTRSVAPAGLPPSLRATRRPESQPRHCGERGLQKHQKSAGIAQFHSYGSTPVENELEVGLLAGGLIAKPGLLGYVVGVLNGGLVGWLMWVCGMSGGCMDR